MIDLEVEKIQSINLKNMELNRYKLDDDIRKSIILYNIAIAEIKTKELDLAINDLKKALSYNRGFPEAIKLLGLCYADNKDFKKAEKTFKKLMKHEIYSELAKEYIENLLVERNTAKTLDAIRRVNDNNKKKQSILVKYPSRKNIIRFSFLIIGIITVYLGSSKLQIDLKKDRTINKLVATKEKTDKISEQNIIKTVPYEEFQNTKKELADTKSELDNYKNKYDIILMFNDAEKAFKDNDYEKAANILINMKSMELDDETKIKFNKMWTDIKTNGVWSIYNQGSKLYKERKYHEALTKLKIASEIEPNLELMPWIIYQIGICYKETNDNINALTYFQKVKNDYPKSNYVSSSEKMINEINNK